MSGGEHEHQGDALAWRLLDLAVIGAVGVCVGLLVAAVANRPARPVSVVIPDSPASLVVDHERASKRKD